MDTAGNTKSEAGSRARPLNVGLIGCGLAGQKRSRGLAGHRLAAAADIDIKRAQNLVKEHPDIFVTRDWKNLLERQDLDCIIVATSNDYLAPITLAALVRGLHVLVEKPGARNPQELDPIIEASQRFKKIVWVGYNHRCHPALKKAKALVDEGAVGELMFIRSRYGHGGRLGYNLEWRAKPSISGGGELLDQGVHCIDLARWFLGDFAKVQGFVRTYFWDMPVEDNAFVSCVTARNQIAWIHASCTEWKNLFSFEIYGKLGKLHVEGLGGSYGMERLHYYRMLPQMGPPETTTWEYPEPDASWAGEFEQFAASIQNKQMTTNRLCDARAVLEIVEKIYRQAKQ